MRLSLYSFVDTSRISGDISEALCIGSDLTCDVVLIIGIEKNPISTRVDYRL